MKKHPHQIGLDYGKSYLISLLNIEEIDKVNPKYRQFGCISIKNIDDIELIKNLCNERNLKYKELSKENITELDYVCRQDLIEEILGYGALCMQSKPCRHSLKYIGKTYLVKYVGYRFIREVYLNLEDELP